MATSMNNPSKYDASKPKPLKTKIYMNKTVAQLLAKQHNSQKKVNKPNKPNKPSKPPPNPIKQSKIILNNEVVNFGKYIDLIKIFNNYVKEKGERPSNTFDLFNYIQFYEIKGIKLKDVSQFLMKYNPSDMNKVTIDISNVANNGNSNKKVPPPSPIPSYAKHN
eukprot:473992_1